MRDGRLLAAQVEMRENDPPIEINQRWVGYTEDGTEVFRRIRILAKHPDGGWICCDEPAKMKRQYYGEMFRCPEFNLRYVFEPEEA